LPQYVLESQYNRERYSRFKAGFVQVFRTQPETPLPDDPQWVADPLGSKTWRLYYHGLTWLLAPAWGAHFKIYRRGESVIAPPSVPPGSSPTAPPGRRCCGISAPSRGGLSRPSPRSSAPAARASPTASRRRRPPGPSPKRRIAARTPATSDGSATTTWGTRRCSKPPAASSHGRTWRCPGTPATSSFWGAAPSSTAAPTSAG